MKEPGYVIFDFDGTIADTLDTSLRIYNEVAPEYDFSPITEDLREILRAQKPQEILKAYGISKRKLFLLLLRIRKELGRHIHDTRPAEGMPTALQEMKEAGYKLGILTSNAAANVSRFLEANSLSGIFGFIYSGKSLFGKDRVIRHMLSRENISADNVIYVGDETRDVEACKKTGIPVIAVSWGLSHREIMASLLPDKIADKPEELLGHVQQIFNRQGAKH